MSLDRLQALLSIECAATGTGGPVQTSHPGSSSHSAAVLVAIHGDQVWRPVTSPTLERIINTRALVLRDNTSGKYYIHVFNGFVEAPGLSGPWTVASAVPSGANQVAQELAQQRVVDLMVGPPDEQDPTKSPSLASTVPEVIVADAHRAHCDREARRTGCPWRARCSCT